MTDKNASVQGNNRGFVEARRHLRAAYSAMRLGIEGIMPRGFTEHRKSAGKEVLLAVRSLLDTALERSGEKNDERDQ